MTAALTFIASCLVGALIIEIRSRYLMRKIIDRRIAALKLDHDLVRAERRAEQSKSDNRNQKNIHRASPMPG
jgi:hypothetical protein